MYATDLYQVNLHANGNDADSCHAVNNKLLTICSDLNAIYLSMPNVTTNNATQRVIRYKIYPTSKIVQIPNSQLHELFMD